MKFKKQIYIFLVLLFSFLKCWSQDKSSLKNTFKNDFLIGAALGKDYFLEKDHKETLLIKKQFNSITAENVMKSSLIHTVYIKYDFDLADKFVAFGQKNKMQIVGHTLIWHSQLSKFAEKISDPDSMRAFIKDHIATVAGRYAGKIKSWDVVNEALNEDGSMRASIFYTLLGEDFIKDAFLLAAKADPKAELYYNDYNIEQPAKRAGTIKLIKALKDKGVRIDGVGIQGHWNIKNLPLAEIEASIIAFSDLGVKVAFTEVDLGVIPNPWDLEGAAINQNFKIYEGDPKMNPYADALPTSVQLEFTKQYEALFKLFLKHKDKISRVTFWGVQDGSSWLNNWPIKGRKNYPLLFDRAYQAKPA